jgi:hypothetical protein
MTEREKIITGLECCQSKSHCEECPYIYEGLCSIGTCTADLASDALTLLKEQEAVVRCRDCIEYKEWGTGKICMRLGSYYGDREPDDFCSLGIRR